MQACLSSYDAIMKFFMLKFWVWKATSDPDYLQKSCSCFLSHIECISVTWTPSKLCVCVLAIVYVFSLHACSASTSYSAHLYCVFFVHIFIFSLKVVVTVRVVVLRVCVCFISCVLACLTLHDLALCLPLFISFLLLGLLLAFFPYSLGFSWCFFLETSAELFTKYIFLKNIYNI